MAVVGRVHLFYRSGDVVTLLALVFSSTAFATSALNASFDNAVRRRNVPACTAVVVRGEQVVWSRVAGTEAAQHGIAIAADSRFRIGSLTKTVIALAVLRLVQRGALDLSAPVTRLAPDLRIYNPWPDRPVLVEHLLEHTSGLPDITVSELYARQADENWRAALHNRELNVRWPAGTRFAYSNFGYAILADVLEHVTGMTIDAVVNFEVVHPLQMSHTSFLRDPGDVVGYWPNGHIAPNYELLYRPAGGLRSSANDLAHVVAMLTSRGIFRGSRYLREDLVQRLETCSTTSAARVGVHEGPGLGVFVGQMVSGHKFISNTGDIDGFASTFTYVPELGVGYAVLINKRQLTARFEESDELSDVDAQLYSALVPQQFLTPTSNVSRATCCVPERFQTDFVPAAPRAELLAPLEALLGVRSIRCAQNECTVRTLLGRKYQLRVLSPFLVRFEGERFRRVSAAHCALAGAYSYYEEQAHAFIAHRAVIAMILTYSSSIVAFLIGISLSQRGLWRVSVLPASSFAIAVLAAMIVVLAPLVDLGKVSVCSVVLYLLSVAHPAFVIPSAIVAVKRQNSGSLQLIGIVLSLAQMGTAGYFVVCGWFAVCLWR